MTTLHRTQLPDTFDVPQAFKDAVYTPQQLLELLGFDSFGETAEHKFWLAYKTGRIPLGVWLPTNRAMCVWDRELIAEWMQAGMPAVENVISHEQRVHAILVQAIEDTLPARPATTEERN